MAERTYLAIALKAFYALVECMERGLDPTTTHLVVAGASRTEKTIGLAVLPALKAYGIPGRRGYSRWYKKSKSKSQSAAQSTGI